MTEFTNRVALVTGASRGIGRAVAAAFASRGARVVVHYNQNTASAEETLALLPGSGHMIVQADVGDPNAVKTMVDHTARLMGTIDILVNNAGIFEEHPPLKTDFEDWVKAWKKTIDINLMGSAHTSFCAARHMIKKGGGRIINITSRGAFRGEPDAPAYGASKAGQNALSQSLAKALAPHHIYVYAVAPGWVATDMAADHLAGPEGDAIRAQSPMNRVAKAEEVADCVVFLALEGHDFMTGAVIDINGASYLRT